MAWTAKNSYLQAFIQLHSVTKCLDPLVKLKMGDMPFLECITCWKKAQCWRLRSLLFVKGHTWQQGGLKWFLKRNFIRFIPWIRFKMLQNLYFKSFLPKKRWNNMYSVVHTIYILVWISFSIWFNFIESVHTIHNTHMLPTMLSCTGFDVF